MDGNRLKELRREKKLTQAELGKIIHVSKVSISGYESGDRSPDTENLRELADFFGVTTDYLLGRSEDPNKTEEEEFNAFANNPDLQKWYKELPKSKEEDLQKLRKMWEIIKQDKNN
ncbi:helix-turn-helix domain-containing protein [Halobacillus litoralis]|uniref:Transcriptional regulator n=1 Tax=Halobacillus litoralis TaxID=45668 RepID=A0A410MDN6_9BACI|nr:helix-turn-helix transcriptional regulator [Halobacillus litoralis]QAS52841.1 transcriptional regulator [Halobacillus litoralis]